MGLSCVAYVAFAFAYSPWILGVGIALQAMAAISGPAVQSIVSRMAGADRQGGAQGALSSFQGLTAIVAPVLAGWVFGIFAAPDAAWHFPGAPFLMAAMAYGVAVWAVRGVRVSGDVGARLRLPNSPALSREGRGSFSAACPSG